MGVGAGEGWWGVARKLVLVATERLICFPERNCWESGQAQIGSIISKMEYQCEAVD